MSTQTAVGAPRSQAREPGVRRAAVGRPWWALSAGLVLLVALTAALVPLRDHSGALPFVVLLYLVPVLVVAVAGGLWPAVAAALVADVLVNVFFVPPFHTLRVREPGNVVVLAVYLAVAATVAVAVDVAARQRAIATRRALEAGLLASATSGPVTETSLEDALEGIRRTFSMTTVALVRSGGGRREVLAGTGPVPPEEPVLRADADDGIRLLGWGPELFAEDRRVLQGLASAAARTYQAQRLAVEARQARELAEVDRLRSALLRAVGHDLRTPLAGIKAAASSLRQPDVRFAPAESAELLATIEESADVLGALVDNLLSMSRLQAGALSLDLDRVPLDDVVARAVLFTRSSTGGSGEQTVRVRVEVPDDLPAAHADPGLLERVLANLVANALTASPDGAEVVVRGHADGSGGVRLDVVDGGPGVPEGDYERIFVPFQRLDDRGGGTGLGLAVARGFTEAMGGTITPARTPGGGLTMSVRLPRHDEGAV